ncbi:tRNA-dihydrouridine synthase [Azoarcus sp. DN11]|uniref:tRNA dihydrouridine synthase n=1 Tax=Azoarcus sp. DN11 TaxID=356837 RepID=UPI00157FA4C5|nr:tRNA-dihydrouridine synthase [Azoarcus sp. DN11]
MRLLLAPMEGLLDAVLRDVLTRACAYDWAVSEFARVSGTLLPHRFYTRLCPELLAGGQTTKDVPVRVQLLGSDPACLADNAARLVELAPPGIDLNFGCPAPTVNRHRGGAVLLDEPELLHRIAAAVRAAVPAGLPFTAKMRLGVADTYRAVECAQALAAGGVEGLVVHARTKLDGYRPPAHWPWIGRIAEAVRIPVTANGEVWSEADWRRCRAESGVADVMLGRGAVADPFLARRLREHEGAMHEIAIDRDAEWTELQPLLALFWRKVQERVKPQHSPGRIKQWLNLLRRNFPQAEQLFQDVRAARRPPEVDVALRRHGIPSAAMPLAA